MAGVNLTIPVFAPTIYLPEAKRLNRIHVKPCVERLPFLSFSLDVYSDNQWGSNWVLRMPWPISDITPASGREVLGCSSNVLAQEIQLVCNNKNGDCSDLYQISAEAKIVRLPGRNVHTFPPYPPGTLNHGVM